MWAGHIEITLIYLLEFSNSKEGIERYNMFKRIHTH